MEDLLDILDRGDNYYSRLSECLFETARCVLRFSKWNLENVKVGDFTFKECLMPHYRRWGEIMDFFLIEEGPLDSLYRFSNEGIKLKPCQIIDEVNGLIDILHMILTQYFQHDYDYVEDLDGNSEPDWATLRPAVQPVCSIFEGLHVPILLLAGKASTKGLSVPTTSLKKLNDSEADKLVRSILVQTSSENWSLRKLQSAINSKGYSYSHTSIGKLPFVRKNKHLILQWHKPKTLRTGNMQVDADGKAYFSRDKKAADCQEDE